MGKSIALIGDGLLTNLVHETLSSAYSVVRVDFERSGDIPESTALVLAVHDEYRPPAQLERDKALHASGIPWLNATVLADEGMVGPYVRPGTPGCPQCALKRRMAAAADDTKPLELKLELWRKGVVRRDPNVSPWGLRHLRDLIVEEASAALERVHSQAGRVRLADLKKLESSYRRFAPDPHCPVCGGLPDDRPEDAKIVLAPRPKSDPRSFRVASTADFAAKLSADFLDDRMGLMRAARRQLEHPFSDVLVCLPASFGEEWTAGRSHAYPTSLAAALLEGLERNCGSSPRGKKTVVYDSYRNLAKCAMNPAEVGLYSPEQYASEDFPFEPFDADASMAWVWGYSFKRERPILVPECLVYSHPSIGGKLADEGSNGCALGGSLEEAILHGIFEVVERDAFLLAWYARLPLPRLDLATAGDRELELMAARLEAEAGYELCLYDATTENGIPSVWAVARNKRPTGANLICAAGASLDPVRAAKGAVYEVAAFTRYLSKLLEARIEEARDMYRDSDQVREMPDHSLVYALPEAEDRLRFLWDPERPMRSFGESFCAGAPRLDLTEDLREVLGVFRRLGLDVIVVDQTSAELSGSGLRCVKVLIPGMLPMTFGHHLRRTAGLNRLFTVPMRLGYTDRPLRPADLNPYPHPFL